nr:FecR domain-containing protein [Pedobacter sp. AK013]
MESAWKKQTSETDYSITAVQGLAQIWDKVEERQPKSRSLFPILKYAAAIVVVISASLGWYAYKKTQQPVQTAIALLSKTTQKGEKVKLILPDSSIVYLGAGSKLTWPSHFVKGGLRNIQLDGEAFFEVKRDTTSPFIVHSGQMQTQVLGTSFNIYAYPKDGTFSVAVRTGKVKVSENSKGKLKELSLLTPGMKILYHLKERNCTVHTERVTEVNAWIKNSFTFKDVTLPNMLKSLERYYNVHIELKSNKLNQCRFNATFSNKSITNVMEQLHVMSGKHLKYKIDTSTKTITVWGEGCQ